MAEDGAHVLLEGTYGFDRLEDLVAGLQQLLEVEQAALVRVDLRGLEFIGPTCLALLVAALTRIRDSGLSLPGSAIQQPRSTRVRRYLQRMDFAQLVSREPPSEDFERRDPVGFRPIQHFRTPQEQWQTSRTLMDALAESCDCDEAARGAIYICLDEICENVLHHADTRLGGFAAAQGWRSKKEFEIGLVDLGVGVRASLSRNPSYAEIPDDAAAIRMALMPRVTATPDRNAGIGLAVTRLLLAANGGEFTVRSGMGFVRDGAEGTRSELVEAKMPGTVVSLRASTDRPLDISSVYETLEQMENGAESPSAFAD
jgi:anti-anti-sigma regulatory factor